MSGVDWQDLPDAAYVLDSGGALLALNPSARQQLGFGPEAPLGALQAALDPGRVLRTLLNGGDPPASLQIEARDSHGRPLALALSLARNPGTSGYVMQARDAGAWFRVERELQRRLDFERRITGASAALIRAGNDQLDRVIVETLGSVGNFLGVDRAYVFVIDEVAGTQTNSHEWVADGISAEAHNLQDIPLTVFPWLLAQLRADQLVKVDHIATLPPEAVNERAEFEREGIQSIIIVPLWHGERLRGFVGFDAVRRQIDWGEDYVIGLRLMAQMLAGVMASRYLSQRLESMAYYDPLTGLPNRKLLEERLELALQRSRRTGSGLVLALVDLDDFKPVNDGHGHAVGDLLLCEVGRRLLHAVGESGTVARLGGDEFVLVREDMRMEQLAALAERLMQVGVEPFVLDEVRLRVGLSVGLTFADGDGRHTREALMRCADAAMYRAKAAGKNRWACDAAPAA